MVTCIVQIWRYFLRLNEHLIDRPFPGAPCYVTLFAGTTRGVVSWLYCIVVLTRCTFLSDTCNRYRVDVQPLPASQELTILHICTRTGQGALTSVVLVHTNNWMAVVCVCFAAAYVQDCYPFDKLRLLWLSTMQRV